MLLFPLAGFLFLVAFGRRIGDPVAGWVGTIAVTAVVRRGLHRAGGPHRSARGSPCRRPQLLHLVQLRRPLGARRHPGRPAVDDHVHVRHRGQRAHPPLRHRLHEERPGLLEVLHLHEPVRLLHAPAGPGGQPAGDVRRVGGCGRLLLLPGGLLVPAGVGGLGGQEGLHLQPHRRRRVPCRHLLDLREDRDGAVRERAGRRHLRAALAPRRRHGHGRRAAAVPGRHREVGPDPAVQLAARRHGRPDAGVRADSRGHHGHGRGLPAVPDEPVVAPHDAGHRGDRGHRRGDGVRGGDDRLRAAGHQEGAGLLDGVADRLHGPGRRHRCLHRGHLPDGHARVLQGPALPRRRLGHPRAGGRAGPQAHGRPAPLHEVDHRDLHHRLPGHRRHPAAVGLLGQGRRPGQRVRRTTRCCGSSGS